MKRLWVALFVFPSMALADVETLQVGQYCSFNDQALPSTIRSFNSDSAAQQAVKRLTQHVGVQLTSFTLRAATVPNAAAVVEKGKRYILYNQRFMRQVNDTARNDWAGISILAHEIGHHLNGHTLGQDNDRIEEELAADQYSGFILQQMGATLEQASLAMKTIPGLEASDTHPGREERIDAVVNGWIKAAELKGKPIPFKRESAPPRNAVTHSHNGRSHSHPLPAEGTDHQHNGGAATASPVPAPRRTSNTNLPSAINLANNLQLLKIPAGSFRMGSNQGADDEKPVHTVTIPRPFWMSKTETTFAQYDAYATASGKPKPSDSGWGRGSRPVINVSWNDALGYAKWLSANNAQNLQCRLPSEAEWEYAARAGTTTEYSWGHYTGKNKANCRSCGSLWDGRQTAPTGYFPANRFGLQDMHGNVWEWVQDGWHDNYQGAPTNGAAWNSDGRLRVLRGGSWSSTPNLLRSAYRVRGVPGNRSNGLGFRVVCSPPSVR